MNRSPIVEQVWNGPHGSILQTRSGARGPITSVLMIAWAGALCACGNSDAGKSKDASTTHDGIRASSIDAAGDVAAGAAVADGGGPVDVVSSMDAYGTPSFRLDGAVPLDRCIRGASGAGRCLARRLLGL